MRTASLLACLFLFLPGAAVAQSPSPAPQEHHGQHGQFSGTEHWVQVFEDPARDTWMKPELVVEMLELRPGMRVADVGAGTGYFSRRLAAKVGPEGEVLALDIQPGLLEYADQKARELGLTAHRTRVVDPSDPALAPESQDRVFLSDVLHHVEPRGPYLQKLVCALKPGGWLVLVEFRPDLDTPVGPPRSVRLDPAVLTRELEAEGLQVETRPGLPYHYVLIGRKPAPPR